MGSTERGAGRPPDEVGTDRHPALAELTAAQRQQAMTRFAVLRPHLHDGVALAQAARRAGVPVRTAQRWLQRYHEAGLVGLVRAARSGGGRRMHGALVALIEYLALRRPAPSAAAIHRRAAEVAASEGWPVPSYSTVYAIVAAVDPATRTAQQDGMYHQEVFDLLHRRPAGAPNEVWYADHVELDIWARVPGRPPVRPWLVVIEDDHSGAVAGYAVTPAAPTAATTALALRRAVCFKPDPRWPICGIPEVFYADHCRDATWQRMEQVAAEIKMRLVFPRPGRPHGRGNIERILHAVNQVCLPELPGHAPRGTRPRATSARLTLPEIDTAIGRFLIADYNHRATDTLPLPPAQLWSAGGFLPRLPELEQLDLLLAVAKARTVRADGVHFRRRRYVDPTLAGYVGAQVVIRYDPHDPTQIRVFHNEKFLCRAVSPELA